MADAVPVTPDQTQEAPVKATKKTSGGISPDVMAELKAQVKEEVLAEMTPQAPAVDVAPNPFKAEGGVKLGSHDAVREDR